MSDRGAAPEEAHRLAAVIRDLVLLTRQAAADLPVSSQQLGVLGSLDAGPRRVSALAGEHSVRTPTMTGIVGRLEQAGAVVRRADDGDARAVAVELTAEGARILARGRAARAAFLQARLDSLAPAERAAVAAALPALARLADRDPPQA